MSQVPLPTVLFFLVTTLAAFLALDRAGRGSTSARVLIVAWLAVQSAIALKGFYLRSDGLPPRVFLMAGLPPLVLVGALFWTASGKRFLDGMDVRWVVLYHSVRILVEINLYLLFVYRQVPALLTFEAGNVDILVGLSAPAVWWAFDRKRIGASGLLLWNALSLLSLLNAVGRALLSAPFPFQRLAFDQPNVAILRFPFVLLLAFVVPAALLCHLALFRRLARR